jgi:uncharacterized protein YecE (DUF72 family)
MRSFVGTSGYSYKEWKGSFYPEKLPAPQMLRYYAERLNTVEINNTFYRMPTEKVLLQWAEQVPEGFTFVLKASRRITHLKRLKDVDDETAYLLRTASVLGDKLGPMLFQLPPSMKKDIERLRAFLDLLPSRWLAAVEFRHGSWFDDEVSDTLRSRNVALAIAETEDTRHSRGRRPTCSSNMRRKPTRPSLRWNSRTSWRSSPVGPMGPCLPTPVSSIGRGVAVPS